MAISSLHLSEKSSPNWKTTWSRQLTFKSFTLPKMIMISKDDVENTLDSFIRLH